MAPEKTIDKIPYDLSRLKPAESYSWIEGGSKVNTIMKKIPFTLGPHRIGRLPAKVSLKYKVRVWRGASCAGGGGAVMVTALAKMEEVVKGAAEDHLGAALAMCCKR